MPFVEPGAEPAAIANPLSEKYAVLRPSLLPGLIDSCAHNRRRARKDIRLFETGSRFVPGARRRPRGGARLVRRGRRAALVDADARRRLLRRQGRGRAASAPPSAWPQSSRAAIRRSSFAAAPLERTRARDGATVPFAILGQLLPSIADGRGFPAAEEIFVAEIDLQALFSLAAGDDLRAESLPRYPAIVRDVSILVSDGLPASHGSWHYPFVSAADAGFDRRVRSLHRKGRSSRAGQPVAAPHLPGCRSHVDRRRGADGDGDDRCRAEAGSRRRATLTAFSDFRYHRCGASGAGRRSRLRHSCG